MFRKKSINAAIAVIALGGGAVLAIPDIASSVGLGDYRALPRWNSAAQCTESQTRSRRPAFPFDPFVIRLRGVNANKSQKALVSVNVKRVHRKKDNWRKLPIFTTNNDEGNPLNSSMR